MRPGDVELANNVRHKLLSFNYEMPGVQNAQQLNCLVEQIIDSVRRIKYITFIRNKQMEKTYIDTSSIFFDPLKAAVWHMQHGDINEAFWLVFLATHFGKNKSSKWELVRNTYGALGGPVNWSWQRITANFEEFRNWLDVYQSQIKATGKFSNHRKYQSLDAYKPVGTGAAIGSYIGWVGSANDHLVLLQNLQAHSRDNPRVLFNAFYKSMSTVISFGRMGKFDYLTMIGKLGLAPIEPDSTYMAGATGAKHGACLLFGGNIKAGISETQLNAMLESLDSHLSLYFGMQVLEDALCNWMKSPDSYVYFNG